jgi:hypothetical protein
MKLTNSMEQSPSCEAYNSSASQEIPQIFYDPKFHHRVHDSLPLVSLLSQISPIHTLPS